MSLWRFFAEEINYYMRFFVVIVLIFAYHTANSAVVVNEIAWMGTAESATNEWIELFNNGNDSVDLTEWTLRIEGNKNKDIALKNFILAQGYYLIERTDDNTLPNIPADLVTPFGAGLANNGASLVLFNAQGLEIDRVNGNNNWNIGGQTAGNNATKETAQRDGSLWFTAVATPRAVNAIRKVPPPPPVHSKTTITPVSIRAKPPVALAPQTNLQAPPTVNIAEDKTISKTIFTQESSTNESEWLWYAAAALLGAFAFLGVRFARGASKKAESSKEPLSADDFEIIEEK